MTDALTRPELTKPEPVDAGGATGDDVLEVRSPISGDLVGAYPVAGADAVDAAVARARETAAWWADLGFDGRKEILDQWRGVIARRAAQLADVVHRETGKPHSDAMLEVALTVDHLAWAAKHAPKALGRRKMSSGPLMANQASTLEYLPLGVIGVIGPWNYPVFTPMGSIGYALAAGNAVVFKPSELTPGVGVWLAEALREVVPHRDLLQVVVGRGETGSALCRSAIDKLAFTGSTATGKKVMATCAENLTPVLIEAGGKDPLIVDEDADVAAAAEAAAWGAVSTAGQTCIGVERVYVHDAVYDDFVARLTEHAAGVRGGSGDGAAYGPMTMTSQVDVIKGQVDDALAKGASVAHGDPAGLGEERTVQPIVLTGVPVDSTAITEETFGPTVAVTRVRDMEEAVQLANATSYGLGSTVYSGSRGAEIARRLRSGMTAVNGVITFAAIPSLPFGGVRDSGFGRSHGEDGLKEFTYAKAVARQKFKPALALTTFGRTEKTDTTLAMIVSTLHGRASQLPKLPRRRG